MTVLDDLGQYLLDTELATIGSIFLGRQPATAIDPCLEVTPWITRSGVRTQDRTRPAIEYPRFRLIWRSVDDEGALALAQAAYEALFVQEVTINGTRYPGFSPLWPPAFLASPDAKDRVGYGFVLEMTEAA